MNYGELLKDTEGCRINVCFEDGTWVGLDLYNCWWEYQDDNKNPVISGGYSLDLDDNTVVDFDGADELPESVVKVLKWFYKIDL